MSVFVFVAVLLIFTSACSKPAPPPAKQSAPQPAHTSDAVTVRVVDARMLERPKAHHHEAPHGGALVMIGDHTGHLEFVLDADSGTLTMYALDGEAERAVPLQSIGIAIQITPRDGPAFTLQLKPVANVLTGETAQSSSQYSAQSDELTGLAQFVGVLPELAYRGMEFADIAFSYPGGAE